MYSGKYLWKYPMGHLNFVRENQKNGIAISNNKKEGTFRDLEMARDLI